MKIKYMLDGIEQEYNKCDYFLRRSDACDLCTFPGFPDCPGLRYWKYCDEKECVYPFYKEPKQTIIFPT